MEFKVCALHFLLIANILLVQSSVLGSNKCNFPAIFNFGDSNSDTGGFSAAFSPVPPPYGETFFHAPAGRNSDGRLIIDFIAESLGLPYLSAFLDSVGSNFSHGANFATSASTIRPQNLSLSKGGYSPISLDVQQVEYSGFVARSQAVRAKGLSLDSLPEKDYFSRALYTFDIGQNDITAGLDTNLTLEEIKAQVPDMIGQFSSVIKEVYSLGGRSFWIHNTAPLGCLTYVLDALAATTPEVDRYGCLIPYNEASQHFNAKLHEAVVQLREELPLAAITYVDIYSAKYALISQAKELGFEDPFRACCGYGGKYNYSRFARCGSKNGAGDVLAKSCKDPSAWISWDGIHFTEAANEWIFHRIADGSFSDPPVSIESACSRCS
ncbi:GDSL esterase/lipase At3g26430-like isoform X2 [Salvia miltiorrhiza]|uniref:GDSL esterase/lipase At3g26430-like isoform X2 n=1 Tax=Salvia miltiorrhiza TaxID=226208 RepID=UPI0025AB9A59|nr:GDSL esterase/lipase At3g26430-like isoform X2 [Salvia miltiorrhiza]